MKRYVSLEGITDNPTVYYLTDLNGTRFYKYKLKVASFDSDGIYRKEYPADDLIVYIYGGNAFASESSIQTKIVKGPAWRHLHLWNDTITHQSHVNNFGSDYFSTDFQSVSIPETSEIVANYRFRWKQFSRRWEGRHSTNTELSTDTNLYFQGYINLGNLNEVVNITDPSQFFLLNPNHPSFINLKSNAVVFSNFWYQATYLLSNWRSVIKRFNFSHNQIFEHETPPLGSRPAKAVIFEAPPTIFTPTYLANLLGKDYASDYEISKLMNHFKEILSIKLNE